MIEESVSRTGAGIILDAAVVRSLLVTAVALFGRLHCSLPSPVAPVLRITAPRRPITDPTRA